MPQSRARVCIGAVNTTVLGGHDQHIVNRAGDADSGSIERLGIDLAIHRNDEQSAKGAGIDVGWREDSFIQLLAGASVIVVISENVCSRR